jgi:hypothetical protein
MSFVDRLGQSGREQGALEHNEPEHGEPGHGGLGHGMQAYRVAKPLRVRVAKALTQPCKTRRIGAIIARLSH